MKKILLTVLVTMVTVLLAGQNLNEIVKKYAEAAGGTKKAEFKTALIEGTMSQMGMSFDLKMMEKKPDKLKMLTTFNGMELVQVINGNSGYMINPLTGSSEAVSLSLTDIEKMKDNSMLTNTLERLLKNQNLELTGSSDIAGEASFELKSSSDTGDTFYYVSKKTFYLIAMKMTVSQMGQQMNVEMRMADFTKAEGIAMPMKIDTYINGSLTGTMTYKTVKFNVDIPDSEFEKK